MRKQRVRSVTITCDKKSDLNLVIFKSGFKDSLCFIHKESTSSLRRDTQVSHINSVLPPLLKSGSCDHTKPRRKLGNVDPSKEVPDQDRWESWGPTSGHRR